MVGKETILKKAARDARKHLKAALRMADEPTYAELSVQSRGW